MKLINLKPIKKYLIKMAYKQIKHKLSEVYWCKNCLNMSTRPRIKFDKRGFIEMLYNGWKKKRK